VHKAVDILSPELEYTSGRNILLSLSLWIKL